jgi:hypothetical protein
VSRAGGENPQKKRRCGSRNSANSADSTPSTITSGRDGDDDQEQDAKEAAQSGDDELGSPGPNQTDVPGQTDAGCMDPDGTDEKEDPEPEKKETSDNDAGEAGEQGPAAATCGPMQTDEPPTNTGEPN